MHIFLYRYPDEFSPLLRENLHSRDLIICNEDDLNFTDTRKGIQIDGILAGFYTEIEDISQSYGKHTQILQLSGVLLKLIPYKHILC